MNKIELLAPAGNMECLITAVNAGADAVYIGGSKFSARAKAHNFSEEEILEAVNYMRPYGAKLYVTVNTLIKDEEMEEAIDYLKFLNNSKIDGVIIQDLGLFGRAREKFPDLTFHASTQMTVHNLEGARLLKSLGYSRVVLSRELSMAQIKEISSEVETEIFIHGALCISYSGACLLSSLIGGNSGNRGRCSQPCRLKYTLEDKTGYLLSPKDVCTLDNMEDIINTGTSSLKIEGRMKSKTYVAAVVSSYRKSIDAALKGEKADLTQENKNLLKVFNREGFSKAYLYGNMGKNMMAYNIPRNSGTLLGRAKNKEVTLYDDLSSKDGVRIGTGGFNIEKIYKNNKETAEAKSGETVRIIPAKYSNSDVLYKTYDYKLEKEMERYDGKFMRKISLKLSIDFVPDEKLHIETIYNGKKYEYYGETVEAAQKSPLTKERIADTFKKSHDTPFAFDHISFNNYKEGFLRIASLNDARRELIASLKMPESPVLGENKAEPLGSYTVDKEIIASAVNLEQVRAILEYKQITLAVNPFLEGLNLDNLVSFIIKLPTVIKEEFPEVINLIYKYKDKIKGIITSNLGIINKLKGEFKIYGDYKLNLLNSHSLYFVNSLGAVPCASLELNKKELEHIKYPYEYLIYGRAEVMISEYNLVKSVLGKEEQKIYKLTDRKGEEFPAVIDKFGRTNIFNSHILNLIEYMEELKKSKSSVFRLDFLEEDYEQTKKVLESLTNGNKTEGSWTYGHYKRGVS